MNTFDITIDGRKVAVQPGKSVLEAARQIGLDIPTLCHLEKCGPLNTCLVCLVKVLDNGQGRLVPACGTKAVPAMVIESETEEVHQARRTALELLFSDHVGDCLSPCQRLCPLQLNIPAMLRQIQAGRLFEAIATVRDALPLAGVLGRLCHHPCEQGCRRGTWDGPAAIRDLERFVTGLFSQSVDLRLPACKPPSRRSVAVIGAGPAGLAAAFHLARQGHQVTVVDRRSRAGGTLLDLPETDLPAPVLEAEIGLLARMGIEFRPGIELGAHVTIEGLMRGFEVILLTVGQLAKGEGEKLGLPLAGAALRADPNTCQTNRPDVFAAGAAVRPVKQLVRAMAEGRAAAECVHRFLTGQPVRRPEKLFSSAMGRLEPAELRQLLRNAGASGRVAACDHCAGLNRQEALTEAGRCLHCDCRSSGNCLLQHYAQVYGADASRFKSERRQFEQHFQPGGVIFEPGKCILCGICVRLAELAGEPLGLAFIGRGFDARVAAPFHHEVADGLQRVAQECVNHCPTGALSFSDNAPAGAIAATGPGPEAIQEIRR
jgi:ferredoxin